MTMATGSSSHLRSNHAVIVSSSRYWFNYRHVVNALAIYQTIKANGVPDENIILMLADEIPANSRNKFKNGIYMHFKIERDKTLYDASIEIDYSGQDATVDNFARALLGRQGEATPGVTTDLGGRSAAVGINTRKPQLNTDENSNILIYLTGHGGDNFFKFQDVEEITSEELGSIIEELHRRKRYNQILLVADTCQAFTLGDHIISPNVTVIGSSLRGESSYAHHTISDLGLSVVERYTYTFMKFLEKQGGVHQGLTIQQAMVDPFTYEEQRANVGVREDLSVRKVDEVLLEEFFAGPKLPESYHKVRSHLLLDNHTTEFTTITPASFWNSKDRVAPSAKRPLAAVYSNDEAERPLSSSKTKTCPFPCLPARDPTDSTFLLAVMAFVFIAIISRRF